MENTEFYWDLAAYAASAVNIIIIGCLFIRFVKPFLIVRKYTGFIGAAYIMVMLILKFCPYEMDAMTAYAAGFTSAFLVMYIGDRRNARQKIFLTVAFYLIEWISWGVILIPWGILYDLLIMPSAMMEHPFLQFGMFIALKLLYLAMIFFTVILFIRFIHRTYTCKKENLSGGELVLMLIPALSALTGERIIRYFSDVYEKDLGQYIWNIHSGYNWMEALYLLMSGATMLIVIFVYQRIKGSRRRELEEAVLLRQIEDMKGHIGEVEKLYSDLRSMKHDMVNHVMTLKSLSGSYSGQEETEKYITRLEEQVNEVIQDIKSGNPVTDVILREKQKTAEEKGIAFIQEFHYPQGTNVSAFDISVILNNAIDNAMEAAGKCNASYVHIRSYCKKNAYMIEVKNNFTGKLIMDDESGLPESTKRGQEHGYGLINIRKVAQKYYGDIDIRQEEDNFILSIMLMLEQ